MRGGGAEGLTEAGRWAEAIGRRAEGGQPPVGGQPANQRTGFGARFW